jgi:choloylglycine hydrolase
VCTDLRLVRLADRHISARTLDFAVELGSAVQVVPRGHEWHATATPDGSPALAWTNALGYVAVDGFGFADYAADGLNEAGLSVATLWLPETRLPGTPPAGAGAAIDFINLAGWLLGTCSTVAEVTAALTDARIWNAPVRALWPDGRPVPDQLTPLLDWAFTEHLAVHDAAGNDLVVEFLDGRMHLHDRAAGVLTNSPTYDWHLANLRNYIGLTNVEDRSYNLMGMPVTATGNGTGLLGMPGDVTPPSRFIRATVLTQVATSEPTTRAAVNQAFHSLDLVSVPRHIAASGDYTQWYVVRDHDNRVLYTRSYDGWTTDAHDLAALGVRSPGPRRTLPLPTAG